MKVYVDLTDGEWRALTTCVSYSNRSCESCCVYPEMQNKKTKCYNCDFTKDREKLIHKLSNSNPTDHDKEVRKQVCDEIREILDIQDSYMENITGVSLTIQEKSNCHINKILDRVEKGEKER